MEIKNWDVEIQREKIEFKMLIEVYLKVYNYIGVMLWRNKRYNIEIISFFFFVFFSNISPTNYKVRIFPSSL